MKTLLPVAAQITCAALTVWASTPAPAQVVYGTSEASGGDNYLYDLPSDSTATGLWTGPEVWGIADDDVNEILYVNQAETLYSWPFGDPAPATSIGTMSAGPSNTIVGISLAYDAGTLYTYENGAAGQEGFFSVDVVTGDATAVYTFTSALQDLGGFDIDPATGLFYATNDGANYIGTDGSMGRGIVVTDAVAMTDVVIAPYPSGATDVDGLAFQPNGTVWLLEDEPAPLHNFDLAAMAYDPAPPMNALLSFELFVGGTWSNEVGHPSVGELYCMANANSTGATASIAANGSTAASDNDLTLTASDLPTFGFGFFITSQTQGFVAMPGGSMGNLCLTASIGRYVGPGQIQNSGAAGSFSLVLDLGAVPQPSGTVSVVAGESWSFQAWYRDMGPMGASSNFTNGVEISFN